MEAHETSGTEQPRKSRKAERAAAAAAAQDQKTPRKSRKAERMAAAVAGPRGATDVPGAAAYMSTSETTIWEWIRMRELYSSNLPGTSGQPSMRRIRYDDLDALLLKYREPKTPEPAP
jgi:hypothetical protein